MGFFGSIGKAFGGLAKGIGGVAKKAFPSVLSVAKSFIPGYSVVGPAIDAISGKGQSDFSKKIQDGVSGSGGQAPGAGGVGSNYSGTGYSPVKKVVVWK